MEIHNTMLEKQKNAASVLENYFKSQNEQLSRMSSSFMGDAVKTAEQQQVIYNCITNIQDNSFNALQMYFKEQERIIKEEI